MKDLWGEEEMTMETKDAVVTYTRGEYNTMVLDF